MTAIKNILHNLVIYSRPELYSNLLIVLFFLFLSYLYSFFFFKKDKEYITVVVRILTGNVVLINAGLLLLLSHSISPVVIVCSLSLLGVVAWFSAKLNISHFLNQFRKTYAWTRADRLHLFLCIIIFLGLLPKVANGFFRWDEMSYHLAYPQFWINSGGWEFDYSMRYPVYSFGMHAVYSMLLSLGGAGTAKLFNGFFFLFILLGTKEIVNYLKLPSLFSFAFVLIIMLAKYFNEWTFTTMLEPSLWAYAFYIVLEILKISDSTQGLIFERNFKKFLPVILLAATAITIKNFMAVYLALYVVIVVCLFFANGHKNLGVAIRWCGYILLVVLATNLTILGVCFFYSGDPVFPLLTMNFPSVFPKIWDINDVNGLKNSVNSTPGIIAKFDVKKVSYILTFCLVALAGVSVFFVVKKQLRKIDVISLVLWVSLSVFLTQVLFPQPELLRYSFFLMPGLLLCIGLTYKYINRAIAYVLCAGVLLICCRPTDLAETLGNYSVSINENGINAMNVRRITYGDSSQIQLLDYLHKSKFIDTLSVCQIAPFKFLMLLDKKVVYGDDIGKYSHKKICNCRAAKKFFVAPVSDTGQLLNCNIVYKNSGYAIYKAGL